MGIQDSLNYMLFTNPVSSSLINLTKHAISPILTPKSTNIPPVQTTIINEYIPLYRLAQEGGPFIRIAGLSGALAVALGAYGAHRTYPKEKGAELQRIFETGNKYHFLNTLALLCVPMCRCPIISGSFLILGMSLFSGACYYHAITGVDKFAPVAPIGGTCLILGWLAMIL